MGFIWALGCSRIYTESISPFRSLKMWSGGKSLDGYGNGPCQAWSVDAACWHKVAAQPSLFSAAPLRGNLGPAMTCPCPQIWGACPPRGGALTLPGDKNYRRDKSCCVGQPCPWARSLHFGCPGSAVPSLCEGMDKRHAGGQQSSSSWTREGLG